MRDGSYLNRKTTQSTERLTFLYSFHSGYGKFTHFFAKLSVIRTGQFTSRPSTVAFFLQAVPPFHYLKTIHADLFGLALSASLSHLSR